MSFATWKKHSEMFANLQAANGIEGWQKAYIEKCAQAAYKAGQRSMLRPVPGVPPVDEAMVKRAAAAYDKAGNKPTVGTFQDAIRAALEAAFHAPSNNQVNRTEPRER